MSFFRRKPEPAPTCWAVPKEPPLPPCPLGCGRRTLFGVWLDGRQTNLDVTTSTEPCEHQLAAVQQMAFEQTHMQTYDPIHDEWHVQPRR